MIKRAIGKRVCEEFLTLLQRKPKWCIYKEVKGEFGFEQYLKHVKGASCRLFLSFSRVPMGCLKSWVGMLGGRVTGMS